MSYEQPKPEHQPERPPIRWEWAVERYASLTPAEIIAALRAGCDETLNFVGHLPAQDMTRAREVYTALADSPLADDREQLAFGVDGYAERNHDHGMELWDRLIRDTDKTVRETALETLDTVLEGYVGEDYGKARHGFRTVDVIDEPLLIAETGFTRANAYDLMLSYAYAENGQHLFDLGQAALAKLAAIEPPADS